MTDRTQPEALRIADEFKLCNEYDSIPSMNDVAKAEAELRLLHAENATLQQGYDAARLEIDSLQARVQELGTAPTPTKEQQAAPQGIASHPASEGEVPIMQEWRCVRLHLPIPNEPKRHHGTGGRERASGG